MKITDLVIIEHGVQNSKDMGNYAFPLIEGIKKYLPNPQDYCFFPYDWNRLAQPRQLEMYESVEKGLWRQKLRKLKHTFGGDIIGTGRSKTGQDFLNKMTTELDEDIDIFLSHGLEFKIHLIGHSQGSQNLCNFMWDSKHKDLIMGFISLGSPISAGSWMFDDWGRVPPTLKYWHNFYNKFDFISSRLEKVHPSDSIKNFVIDHEVPLGINPLNYTLWGSHSIYWKSDFCHKKIAEIFNSSGKINYY